MLFRSQDQAHAIVLELGASNLKVQMDLYHCQIVEGDLAMKLRQYLPTGKVGHIQIAGVPGRENEVKTGVLLAIEYAQALGCPRIHLMAGLVPEGLERTDVQPTYVDNLRWAAGEAAKAGLDVLIEPINTRDIPRFFLNRQDHAHDIVQEVGAANLKVQMDLYHCQIVEGDVASKIRQYLPSGRVGHFQIAGVPERHEPDIGEVNYPYLFDVIDEVSKSCGWQGWIGCEYRPLRGAQAGGTSAGLGWLKPWL